MFLGWLQVAAFHETSRPRMSAAMVKLVAIGAWVVNTAIDAISAAGTSIACSAASQRSASAASCSWTSLGKLGSILRSSRARVVGDGSRQPPLASFWLPRTNITCVVWARSGSIGASRTVSPSSVSVASKGMRTGAASDGSAQSSTPAGVVLAVSGPLGGAATAPSKRWNRLALVPKPSSSERSRNALWKLAGIQPSQGVSLVTCSRRPVGVLGSGTDQKSSGKTSSVSLESGA